MFNSNIHPPNRKASQTTFLRPKRANRYVCLRKSRNGTHLSSHDSNVFVQHRTLSSNVTYRGEIEPVTPSSAAHPLPDEKITRFYAHSLIVPLAVCGDRYRASTFQPLRIQLTCRPSFGLWSRSTNPLIPNQQS